MTVKQLHDLTGKLIAKKQGNIDVAINLRTFEENENGGIMTVESTSVIRVQGIDDSGPIGAKEPFMVFDGGFRE